MLTFGPVPSRRLGRSIGINNIPPKLCTYSCCYCQLGRTRHYRAARRKYHDPRKIVRDAEIRLKKATGKGEKVDIFTFVPDGEPTLDSRLGQEIESVRDLGVPVAVITNSSLLDLADVRDDLGKADVVSIKVDTVTSGVWERVNDPADSLKLDGILDGIRRFSGSFRGRLITETMLIEGINTHREEMERVARFISTLSVERSYITSPTRPPTAGWVRPPDERALATAFRAFEERGIDTECIVGYEGNDFASTGDFAADLLNITSVHPMRKTAVEELLSRSGGDWDTVENLINGEKLVRLEFEGEVFFVRRLPGIRR